MGFCMGYKMNRFLVALGLFCCAQSLQAQALKTLLPDLTWGTGGVVQYGRETSPNQQATAAYLQPDEKLLVQVQGNPEHSWVRFNPNGQEDLSFRQSLLAQTLLALSKTTYFIHRLVWDSQGRIVLFGYNEDALSVIRISSNGALDTGFNITLPNTGNYQIDQFRLLKDDSLLTITFSNDAAVFTIGASG
jgi:hypothetical protein